MAAPQPAAPRSTSAVLPGKVAAALLGLAVVRFWLMPLPSSLWLDETGTVWAIQGGLGQLLSRIHDWPTVTPVYGFLAWLAQSIGGPSEAPLRLPSVIAIALAAWFVYRLGRRLANQECGYSAAIVFICTPTVIFAATDARPYAVLLLAVAGSTYALVRWIDRPSWGAAALYALAAGAIPHLHYLASILIAAHGLYLVLRLCDSIPKPLPDGRGSASHSEPRPSGSARRFAQNLAVMKLVLRLRGGSEVPATQCLGAAAGIALLAAPLLPEVRRILEMRGRYSFADPPTLLGLAQILTPPALIVSILFALPVARIYCRRLEFGRVKLRPATVGLIAASLAPVVLFFAASTTGATRLFVPRYVIGSQVAFALLAGWLVGSIGPAPARSIVRAAILLGALLAFGSPDKLWPPHLDDDWRGAVATIRQATAGTDVPVVMQIPFIEAFTTRFDFTRPLPAYLFAPLAAYPLSAHLVTIPFGLDPAARAHLETHVLPPLRARERFILVNRLSPHLVWMQSKFPGYRVRPLGDFGAVEVHLFERPRLSGTAAN